MLTATGLCFSYGLRTVFSQVSLTLRAGETLALIGPNGAGKTTLLHVLSGVKKPTSGNVRLSGTTGELWQLPARVRAQHLAMVEQGVVPAFDFQVQELVAMGLYARGGNAQTLDQAMRAVSVADLAHRRLHELSAGEKQRVFLALALAQKPRVLFLDEPLSHLDPKHQLDFLATLSHLVGEGLSVLWSVHDLNLARFADRIALLSHTRLLAVDVPEKVLTQELLETAYGLRVRLVSVTENEPPIVVLHSG